MRGLGSAFRAHLLYKRMSFFQLSARPRQNNVCDLSTIKLCRPDLETINRRLRHHAAVQRKPIAFLG